MTDSANTHCLNFNYHTKEEYDEIMNNVLGAAYKRNASNVETFHVGDRTILFASKSSLSNGRVIGNMNNLIAKTGKTDGIKARLQHKLLKKNPDAILNSERDVSIEYNK